MDSGLRRVDEAKKIPHYKGGNIIYGKLLNSSDRFFKEKGERMNLPLNGIRVLEMAHAVMGPSCGMVLADMGAEVIKVERAPDGDETRKLIGFGRGFHVYFNRNKKSLAVDLKAEKGKELLKKMVPHCDVFVENFGPGTVTKLGFGYEELARINPPEEILLGRAGFG